MSKQVYTGKVTIEFEYTVVDEQADNIIKFAFDEGVSINSAAKSALRSLFLGWAMGDEHFIGTPGQSLDAVTILGTAGPLRDFKAKEIS